MSRAVRPVIRTIAPPIARKNRTMRSKRRGGSCDMSGWFDFNRCTSKTILTKKALSSYTVEVKSIGKHDVGQYPNGLRAAWRGRIQALGGGILSPHRGRPDTERGLSQAG